MEKFFAFSTDPLWGESTSQRQFMQALDVFFVLGGVRPHDANMPLLWWHYSDVMMSAKASQITAVTFVHWTMCSCVDQRKHRSSASLAFVRGIHRLPVNSPHKGPITRKMISFDDVIMKCCNSSDSFSDLEPTLSKNMVSFKNFQQLHSRHFA